MFHGGPFGLPRKVLFSKELDIIDLGIKKKESERCQVDSIGGKWQVSHLALNVAQATTTRHLERATRVVNGWESVCVASVMCRPGHA